MNEPTTFQMSPSSVEASAVPPTLVMSVENCTEIYGNVTQCLYSGYQTTITCFIQLGMSILVPTSWSANRECAFVAVETDNVTCLGHAPEITNEVSQKDMQFLHCSTVYFVS